MIPARCHPEYHPASRHGGLGKRKAAASQPGLCVCLLAPGSSCEKHGDARRCHIALGRCKLCSSAQAAVFLGTGGEEGGKNSLQPCYWSPGVKYMTSGSEAGGQDNLVLPQTQCCWTPVSCSLAGAQAMPSLTESSKDCGLKQNTCVSACH